MRAELGEQLRDARTARGLSLEATSRAAKISQGYLHKLEAGRVQNPSPRVLQRLSEVLDVPYARLMQLADYLLPADPAAPVRHPPQESAMTQPTAAPTNAELARHLEAIRAELAQLRQAQERLAAAVQRLADHER